MGALPPRYSLVLNAHTEVASRRARDARRRLAFANYRVRSTLRDSGSSFFARAARLRYVQGSSPSLDYLVLGTVDLQVWRRGLTGGVSFDELVRNMADFSRHMQFEQIGHGWEPAK